MSLDSRLTHHSGQVMPISTILRKAWHSHVSNFLLGKENFESNGFVKHDTQGEPDTLVHLYACPTSKENYKLFGIVASDAGGGQGEYEDRFTDVELGVYTKEDVQKIITNFGNQKVFAPKVVLPAYYIPYKTSANILIPVSWEDYLGKSLKTSVPNLDPTPV